ncbi:MAG: putative manganese transporter, partial [Actinomycetota bacterium]|nr:putative manganese transporter [Actinomycetota bacterium]
MFETLVDSLVDAFMEIGVLVATMLAVITWLQSRWASLGTVLRSRFRRLGPIFAAILSLPPGCGGAIAVVSMYGRGLVSFGTVVAALLSTMGDAAWILLAADFELTVILKLLFFVLGSAMGLAIDLLGYDPRPQSGRGHSAAVEAPTVTGEVLRAGHPVAASIRFEQLSLQSFHKGLLPPSPTAEPNSSPCIISRPSNRLSSQFNVTDAIFWSAVIIGLLVKIPVEMNVVTEDIFEETFGPLNPYVIVGLVGTLSAVVIAIRAKRQCHDCLAETAEPGVPKFTEIVIEASRIIFWVAVAYGAWAFVTEISHLDAAELRLDGVGGVVLAALVGLLPSCGLEAVMAGLFTSGAIPIP